MNKIKISVIGCGYWGKNLVRNLSELGVLDSICDKNTIEINRLAEKYSVSIKKTQDILNSDVDAIVIATPAETHYEIAKKALLAKKHVFVEKPIALNLHEGQELCDLSEQVDRVLMVGHLLQYHSAFNKLKDYVQNGKLGKLQYIYSNRLNLGKFRSEENILWSFAPHDVSMILALSDSNPLSIYSTGAAYLNPSTQDVTTTHIAFKNGIKAHIFVSWLHPYKEQKLVVVGDRGMAVFDDSLNWNEKIKLYPHQVSWVNGSPEPEKADFIAVPAEENEPLMMECEHFIECCIENKKPRTDGNEGVRVLQILDAAQQSLYTNSTFYINKNAKKYYAHKTAYIDEGSSIGDKTKIWHFSHVMDGVSIGKNCVIGQNVMIGPGVNLGNNCKIQNNVSLYNGVTLEDGVFCGPSCVFTNVHNPRAEIERKNEYRITYVEKGVTIGANATIICGNRLGAYSLIGAGAVITKDVKPHSVMVGNPAKQIGWVSHAGERLGKDMVCPREGRKYRLDKDSQLIEIAKYHNELEEVI